MLGLGAATRIYVATGATDMRLGFDGLYGLVSSQLEQNPQSGHLFLFSNKRRDRNRFAMDPESGHLFLFSNAKRDRMKVLFFDLC